MNIDKYPKETIIEAFRLAMIDLDSTDIEPTTHVAKTEADANLFKFLTGGNDWLDGWMLYYLAKASGC